MARLRKTKKNEHNKGAGKASAGQRERTSPTVALFIETSREFGRGLLYGIARYSRLHGPWKVHRRPAALDSSLPDWQGSRIDGAIVRDVKMFDNLMRAGFPVIFAQHHRESCAPFPSITTDSVTIGRMGAEHFLDRGFQNFAYCGLDDFIWSRLRCQYFTERIGREGLRVEAYRQPRSRTKRSWKTEQYVVADWLRMLPKPVGLMCCNDDRALQAIEACKLAELYVPDDVAILGVDNDVLVCDLSDPPLSSVALNTEAAGYEAARLLDELMGGRRMSGRQIVVTATHIVTRMSTDIMAVSDAEISAALRFIRNNAARFIQVDDVVRATALSRRVLEKRFRGILRRSIHREIRRVRVNYIVQLLIATDMSVTEIAQKSGFDGIEHISRYFRKETGMSLRGYRKRYSRR